MEKRFNKSVVQQIEESTEFTPMESSVTEKDFMSFLQDLSKSPSRPKPMTLFINCLDRGFIQLSTQDFSLCDNPNCKPCRNSEVALKEQCK
jgi:hypothetical protein